jgi:hypothetical protein
MQTPTPPVSGNTPTYGMPPVNPTISGYPGYPTYDQPPQGYQQQPPQAYPQQPPQGYQPPSQAYQQPPQGYQPVPANYSQMPTQPPNNQPLDPFAGQLPISITNFERGLLIRGGQNGNATGFFISNQGYVATTRYAIGQNTQVEVVMSNGQTLNAVVVRSFPAFDLAILRVNARVQQLMPFSATPLIMDDSPLVNINYRNEGKSFKKRATRQSTAPQWFPTTLNELTQNDAGGGPVVDARQIVVGMITRNKLNTNNYFHGLHIGAIFQALETYVHEVQSANGAVTYCPSCGSNSRAVQFNGFYCETCGSTLPLFLGQELYPQSNANLTLLYNENNPPCRHCGARVGYYKNKCLRCEGIST